MWVCHFTKDREVYYTHLTAPFNTVLNSVRPSLCTKLLAFLGTWQTGILYWSLLNSSSPRIINNANNEVNIWTKVLFFSTSMQAVVLRKQLQTYFMKQLPRRNPSAPEIVTHLSVGVEMGLRTGSFHEILKDSSDPTEVKSYPLWQSTRIKGKHLLALCSRHWEADKKRQNTPKTYFSTTFICRYFKSGSKEREENVLSWFVIMVAVRLCMADF